MNVVFEMEKETRNTIRFTEVDRDALLTPKIDTIYVPKATLNEVGWKTGRMNHDCGHCRFADISSGTRTIRTGNMIITQNGENNIVCKNYRLTSINFINNGQMICGAFEPKDK